MIMTIAFILAICMLLPIIGTIAFIMVLARIRCWLDARNAAKLQHWLEDYNYNTAASHKLPWE